ncbi:AraC-type DNA-binding protein [Streptomyces sp. TLI_053]|uniref:AraC-like ligand-binding domain-containing protein n=1 Tax=Streptomyces sp. TLI_053 TaxID=1855352 RepID=UPI00087A1688|nr:helix-turn-helix domain-containing protein [Streptomyces sp. TLI_053]SDS91614.1 AraC-type DNA-binding protein [Streptomyces sp. TLI_053]
MGWSSVSAAVVPAADRFEWFREAVATEVMPLSVSSDHVGDFHADIAGVELGPVRMASFAYSPIVARRSAAHVRQGDPEDYQLTLVSRGCFRLSHLGREEPIAGDMVLADTSRPMVTECVRADGPVRALVLQVPRSAVPLRPDRVDRLLARRIPARRGSGAILSGFLNTLAEQAPYCAEDELAGLGPVLVDLVGACLAHQLGVLDEVPADARARLTLERVLAFIEHNLGDPDLTPRLIAERHHLSLRALYALFEDRPESVSATVRRRRLERSHADLARRDLGERSVRAVAARWGFSSHTAFSRAFRERYGITPREHRAVAVADVGAGAGADRPAGADDRPGAGADRPAGADGQAVGTGQGTSVATGAA